MTVSDGLHRRRHRHLHLDGHQHQPGSDLRPGPGRPHRRRGRVISLDAGATDPDGDTLTYAASGLPAGLTINTATGLISGTLGFNAAAGSPYSVSLTVRDGLTVDATDTFTWTVTNTNQDPTFDQLRSTGPTPRATSSASMPMPPIPTATP